MFADRAAITIGHVIGQSMRGPPAHGMPCRRHGQSVSTTAESLRSHRLHGLDYQPHLRELNVCLARIEAQSRTQYLTLYVRCHGREALPKLRTKRVRLKHLGLWAIL